ncbi:GNAT family N-acetyltransferase [Amnibacterium kyonggiense]
MPGARPPARPSRRPRRPRDDRGGAGLLRRGLRGRDDDPIAAEEFAPPRGGFLLGRHDGEAVAMGGWSFLPGDPGAVKIRRMYVRPAVRRLGFAAALLDRLEADARAAGAARVALTTGEPQVAAIRFYRARGYAEVPPFGFYAAQPSSVHLGKTL